MVYELLRRLGRTLLPASCILCSAQGQEDLDLCDRCHADLLRNHYSCSVCAEPLDAIVGALCGACIRRRPRFRSTHCAYRYDYPLAHVIRAYKYQSRIAYSRVLGELLARSLAANRSAAWPQLLLPVPLGRARFAERGFNQAMEIAKHVAARLSIPIRTDILKRCRETAEQAGLERAGRRRNVRNAFTLVQPLETVHVAVIDDVVTTGSTVSEIARVLRRAGVNHIEIWALARASR